MTKITFSAAFAALVAGPALAGGLNDPAPVAVIAPAPVVMAPSVDWTGFYLGAGVGKVSVEGDGGFEDDGTGYAIHGGYLYDIGTVVLGGELDYGQATLDASDGELDVLRLKGRVGYDAGSFMPYATAGVARLNSDDFGIDDESGTVYGLGADYAVTDSLLVGAEFLQHDFEDIDTEATSFGLRGSFKF
eukprot:TRINITY_DN57138_c0_g1_i1.p2 TRINITY_DN57138_c0_g1~~TRINITY_DN57138_c0_g1_i1.p2  ORF type:complete len:189 (-),score=50.79 TRINITY_DN57138_c0_g1_i1:31-597(-)